MGKPPLGKASGIWHRPGWQRRPASPLPQQPHGARSCSDPARRAAGVWLPTPLLLLCEGFAASAGTAAAVKKTPVFIWLSPGTAKAKQSRKSKSLAPRLPPQARKMQQPGKPERARSSRGGNERSQGKGMSRSSQSTAALQPTRWDRGCLPSLPTGRSAGLGCRVVMLLGSSIRLYW